MFLTLRSTLGKIFMKVLLYSPFNQNLWYDTGTVFEGVFQTGMSAYVLPKMSCNWAQSCSDCDSGMDLLICDK